MDRTRRHQEVCFTLDILTDGSEFTGNGTIFLSGWKKPQVAKDDWLEECMNLQGPICRYAIAGIGDLTARLAADQRFKLSTTQAVFVPARDCFDGLSALMLSLRSAGAPSLHIVSTQSQTMEELSSTVLGPRCQLQITNCQVPGGDNISKGLEEATITSVWWQVYDDTHLIVHASRRDVLDVDKVTYLFSMRNKTQVSTILLLPPGCPSVSQAYKELLQATLPLLQNNDPKPINIDYIIALNPIDDKASNIMIGDQEIPVMITSSDNNRSLVDPGILIRSQKMINLCSKQLPAIFPRATTPLGLSPDHFIEQKPLCLHSCTSVIFDITVPRIQTIMDRRKVIWDRPITDESTSSVASLKTFSDSSHMLSKQDTDENEIDLDDEDSNDETDVPIPIPATSSRMPRLFVLGTGCATPSAIRGASGYALRFPCHDGKSEKSDVFILDCGEGVATMLSRYGPHDWLDAIRGIWISHAHLDHYGGLPTLLRILAKERDKEDQFKTDQEEEDMIKRRRTTHCSCWVMAPPKVLRYIDLCLDCHHGRRKSDGRQIYDPRLPHDPTIPPGPWTHFENIRVLHNCHPAHGLLLGWRLKRHETDSSTNCGNWETSWFCFSGDTRPSHSLIQACRKATLSEPSTRRFFLLHEATFEDAERDQANRKKHSTVCEALEVASKIGASRVLLTHFSQRYVSLQALTTTESSKPALPVGLAIDGLCVALE